MLPNDPGYPNTTKKKKKVQTLLSTSVKTQAWVGPVAELRSRMVDTNTFSAHYSFFQLFTLYFPLNHQKINVVRKFWHLCDFHCFVMSCGADKVTLVLSLPHIIPFRAYSLKHLTKWQFYLIFQFCKFYFKVFAPSDNFKAWNMNNPPNFLPHAQKSLLFEVSTGVLASVHIQTRARSLHFSE